MLLFKPQYVPLIMDGMKTETRRVWKKRRAKPGSIHQCRVNYTTEPFAYARVLEVFQQRVSDMTGDDARADGFPDLARFLIATRYMPGDVVWVVRFERCDKLGLVPWSVSSKFEEPKWLVNPGAAKEGVPIKEGLRYGRQGS